MSEELRHRLFERAILLAIFFIPFIGCATADVTLVWEHTGKAIDGYPVDIEYYNVYRRAKNKAYPATPCGSSRQKRFVYSPPIGGKQRWFFAVTAVADNGAESERSNELYINTRTNEAISLPAAPGLLLRKEENDAR